MDSGIIDIKWMLGLLISMIFSSGLTASIFLYRLRKREKEYELLYSRLIEHKVDVYVRCSAFLRKIKSYPLKDAIDVINELADELMMWASPNVYEKVNNLFWHIINNDGTKMDWSTDVVPIIKTMTMEVNPSAKVDDKRLLPWVKYVDTSKT